MTILYLMILVIIAIVAWGIFILCYAVDAIWLALLNPSLKYDDSNEKISFRNLKMEKTRNIFNHCI